MDMDPSSCMICSFSGPGLHRFPRDKKRLKDWLVGIERTDLLESEFICSIVYNSGRVCKAHFSDSCYREKYRKTLLKNAVPRLTSLVKKKSTAEDKCSITGKKAPVLRKYRHCKKTAKNEAPRLSSTVKKKPTTKEKCSTTGKKAPNLRKHRHCRKIAKNAVPRLSSTVKKSTTKGKCSTNGKEAPNLRKHRYCKKMTKKAVPSLPNTVKNKSSTKKRRISENAQDCSASQGDNNDVSEKSSYVNEEIESSDNIKKESSINKEMEFSENIEKESSVNIKMESSENIEKESSVNIEMESSDNIEKKPLVTIENESSDGIEKEASVNIEVKSLVKIENPFIQKEFEAEIPNKQSITCEENKTKNGDLICPMKKIFEENIGNVVSGKKEPEKIIGATKVLGELLFLVKWKGVNEADLLPSTFVRKKFSELLIQFYEERLEWGSPRSRENWYK